MRAQLNKFGLIVVSIAMGFMLSMTYSAVADKSTDKDAKAQAQLPLDELRAFAEVFGKIKTDYVEPVDDKKLISEAIKGMVSGLDPAFGLSGC